MNAPDTDLVKSFCDLVAVSIDPKGIYPNPCLWRGHDDDDDDKLTVGALALGPLETADFFATKIACECVREIFFGLDRSTRPGQGTEFADVLTCAYWRDMSEEMEKLPPDQRTAWNRWVRVGVINYQHEPRIVRSIDWNNEFWTAQVMREVHASLSKFQYRIAIKTAKDERRKQCE